MAVFTLNAVALVIFWPFRPPPPPKPWTPHPTSCIASLGQMSLAMAQYEVDNDARLPDRDQWMDSIERYVPKPDDFYCPDVVETKGAYGYAMNGHLSHQNASTVSNRETTQMIYDSINMARNASDLVIGLPAPGRHEGHNNVAYLDGHINQIVGKVR